jgi:predicted TPR repeat methyltransferase
MTMDAHEAEALFKQAVELQQQGDLKQARALYERILATHKQHYHALHLLGVIASVQGDQFLARRLIESALALSPDDADAWGNLGQVLFHMGECAKAIDCCDRSISLQQGNPRTHLTRGKALRVLERHQEALESLNTALALQPDLADAHGQVGLCLHSLGRVDEALPAYDGALQLRPDNPEILNQRGYALFALGRREQAQRDVEHALRIAPDFADAHYLRGMLLQHDKRYADALPCYRRAIELKPDHAQALIRLAFVLSRLKAPAQESIAALDRALRASPADAAALGARGGLLAGLRLLDQALDDYDRAVALTPGDAKMHSDRGECLLLLKRPREAALAFREALALGGDKVALGYVLASLGEEATPRTAPRDYVVNLFDWYAESFDSHLQGRLNYQTPELICAQIAQLRPQGNIDILDLGCGTGLCGPLLKPLARRMVGVDLSPNMLEVARRRAIYDELVCSELLQFMTDNTSCYDLLVCTDVFIYVGALDKVFEAARKTLRPGGLFAFSLEASEKEDLVLRPSRRYAHSLPYVRRLASINEFQVVNIEPSVIRQEGGQDLNGFLVVLSR